MRSSSIQFTVDIAGERQLSRTLHGLLGRVADWRPVFEAIAEDWSESRAATFGQEGAFEGGRKWAPLSERYARWKARHFPGMPILQRTGALQRATTQPVTELSAQQLVLTIDNDYAVYHQSPAPRQVLPRRPFASLTRLQRGRWVGILRRHIWGEDTA
ncbi:MAG: phage virion morphogenesis protein [Armatimonadetes bacterium]|nr:phage virion morphogenesis protein [Armatimonadota bacterium]